MGKDTRLFVTLTAPWHAARTSCKTSFVWLAPSYALDRGAPVYRGPCASQWAWGTSAIHEVFGSTELFKYFFDYREPPIEPADLDLYAAILIKAGEIGRQRYGVPTLVLYLPDDLSGPRYRLGPGCHNEDIMRKLRDGGLDVLDASIDKDAYPGQDLVIPGDGHPTGLANRIWAARVRDFVSARLASVKRSLLAPVP